MRWAEWAGRLRFRNGRGVQSTPFFGLHPCRSTPPMIYTEKLLNERDEPRGEAQLRSLIVFRNAFYINRV